MKYTLCMPPLQSLGLGLPANQQGPIWGTGTREHFHPSRLVATC